MLIRFQDLVTLAATTRDGSRHPIEDVFVTDKSLRVLYVVADVGGWLQDRKVVVSIDRFGDPDVEETTWPCTLEERELVERPAPETIGEGESVSDAMLLPAGSPVSPRYLHRSSGGEGHSVSEMADPKGKLSEGAHLRSVGEWILDTDVHASDGPAGKLMGFIFDTSDWTARYLVVETGGSGMPQNQRVIEATYLQESDFDARTVTLSLPLDRVNRALDLHEVDGVEGKWYNKVMAYYGLQS